MSATWDDLMQAEIARLAASLQKDFDHFLSMPTTSRTTHDEYVTFQVKTRQAYLKTGSGMMYSNEMLGAWNAPEERTRFASEAGSQGSLLAKLDAVAEGSLRSNSSSRSEASVASPTRVTAAVMTLPTAKAKPLVVPHQWTLTSTGSPVRSSFLPTRTPCRLVVKRLWPSSPSPRG